MMLALSLSKGRRRWAWMNALISVVPIVQAEYSMANSGQQTVDLL